MRVSASILREWRENVSKFAYDNFKFEADRWQKKVFDLFPSQDHEAKQISMQACTGPGKTDVATICALNFISCYGRKNEHPQGLVVSITEDNLLGNFWPRLASLHNRSDYLKAAFKWSATRYSSVDHAADWFLDARTWSKKADKESQGATLSGFHPKYGLIVIEEGGNIPVPILKSAKQAFSGTYNWMKILMDGNPTSLEGCLYHAASVDRANWTIIPVTADPSDPDRSPRIPLKHAQEQIDLYGRDNPWVMATILGKFPPASINQLLGIEDVEKAMKRRLSSEEYDFQQKRLGVDVARFGDDRSVLFPRQGLRAFNPIVMRVQNTVQIAARCATGVHKWTQGNPLDEVIIMIDDTGHWGHGVFDNLQTAQYAAIPIQYHGPASDPRYKNKRTEMAFLAAEWVKSGGWLPNFPALVSEATAATYSFLGGKLILEDKRQIKQRLGSSPDLWDAFQNTFCLPDQPAKIPGAKQGQRERADFDPLAHFNEQTISSDYDPLAGNRI